MAAIPKLDSFKIGDTPTFAFPLYNTQTGFVWSGSGITYDIAMTSQATPTDNSLAIATIIGATPTPMTDAQGNAYALASLTLTQAQANNLKVGTIYYVELQLHDTAAHTSTVATYQVSCVQDYVK